MTSEVITVGPDTPAREIARILAENGISAVPVVDNSGAPIGIVSEGDLVARDEADRVMRRDWWLTLLAEGETMAAEFMQRLAPDGCTARDVMSAPVITVGSATDVTDIARLLATYRIKRVPVVDDGRIVGIVSRADLVRALAAEPARPAASHQRTLGRSTAPTATHPAAPSPPSPRSKETFSVREFRQLVALARDEAASRQKAARKAAEEFRLNVVKTLIDHHVTDEIWQDALRRMRSAAERGEKELMLLRFPAELCSDGGRAVNAPEPDWPSTLRGEAAEFYLRWQRDLKPLDFRLTARVLDFPGGFPGDLGLFLAWGE
ncbi:MAG TPA: CBS domain-containing protein [Stellaceae bacterium]|nr:CBS domain-containing protein [Stellaceae bacterium]